MKIESVDGAGSPLPCVHVGMLKSVENTTLGVVDVDVPVVVEDVDVVGAGSGAAVVVDVDVVVVVDVDVVVVDAVSEFVLVDVSPDVVESDDGA